MAHARLTVNWKSNQALLFIKVQPRGVLGTHSPLTLPRCHHHRQGLLLSVHPNVCQSRTELRKACSRSLSPSFPFYRFWVCLCCFLMIGSDCMCGRGMVWAHCVCIDSSISVTKCSQHNKRKPSWWRRGEFDGKVQLYRYRGVVCLSARPRLCLITWAPILD